MENGIKLALVMVALLSIVAGLMWDSVLQRALPATAEPEDSESADASDTAQAESELALSYQLVNDGESFDDGGWRMDAATEATTNNPAVAPPVPAPPAPPTSADEIQIHQVESGETLSEISTHYYGTMRYWQRLMEFNGVSDAKDIKPGDTLRIPPKSTWD